ncbi:L,D-transpeptidase family protein [Bacillus suaedae]|uniref:L,D-transpeptidase family protein n=1 Tax=Halalkalibacter suaedae TaxID=2822140 RepID=A0A940WUZ4_9BACI|nr:L,D-transpeptidase family protein [Bacillus suaedae]MBP3950962.1 L,D-transpeptidase family protein [Bacillus suaedae]
MPPQKISTRWFRNWKVIVAAIILFIVLIISAISMYQLTHFSSNTSINNIDVSGLTADQTLATLQSASLTNHIYIGEELILEGTESEMSFTEEDLPEIKKTMKNQWSLFPSSKEKKYYLQPGSEDQYRSEDLRNELEQTLISINQHSQAPIDAYAHVENGEITISESIDGEQYDVSSLLEAYDQHEYTSEIHLQPMYLQPIKEDNEIVQSQVKKWQDFLSHTIEYQIQDQTYPLEAKELIINASFSEEMDIVIDSDTIKEKITDINDSKSTLEKDLTFKTTSDSTISVKGQGYGWALDVEKEAAMIKEAFQNGDRSISASHIIGNGWNGEGYGYDVTSNAGIGTTYAEVSIAEQKMWIYKEGQLVLTTNVVTGDRSTQQDTLTGVWYILYKRTPYTLTGEDYSIDVNYWAPFTNSGQGFHDAAWRSNWSSNAYLNAGSNGCVNVPPEIMKKVYDYLEIYDPVVIY